MSDTEDKIKWLESRLEKVENYMHIHPGSFEEFKESLHADSPDKKANGASEVPHGDGGVRKEKAQVEQRKEGDKPGAS